jgi:CubicO group peptidase (beta-lactamase class C family)
MSGSPTNCGRRIARWAVLATIAGGVTTPGIAQQATWPTHGWSTSSPEAQGLDAAPLTALSQAIDAGAYGHVDRLVVVRHGYLVLSQRWERDYRAISRGHADALGCGAETCPDTTAVHQYNYYHPDHHPYYQGRDVHSLQSVTKSVTATLIGIAIGRGEISGVDAPLLSFFEDYDLSGVDDQLRHATLEDLLTMRSGIEWHEDRPFDSTNTTLRLEWSQDWIQFTLNQPMDAEPGEKWAYNSGGSHLMSGIIKAATGMFVDEYAEAYLFGPLGITDYHWKRTPKGYPDTEGGLYLEAEQLAKIGYLYLQDGVWEGRRLVPVEWVRASTARHVESVNRAGWGYGYQWWRLDRDGTEVWAGLGFGGQFLLVLPERQLIGVVNCWNLFGEAQRPILGGLLEALLAAAGQ